jgi:hypothetical protein
MEASYFTPCHEDVKKVLHIFKWPDHFGILENTMNRLGYDTHNITFGCQTRPLTYIQEFECIIANKPGIQALAIQNHCLFNNSGYIELCANDDMWVIWQAGLNILLKFKEVMLNLESSSKPLSHYMWDLAKLSDIDRLLFDEIDENLHDDFFEIFEEYFEKIEEHDEAALIAWFLHPVQRRLINRPGLDRKAFDVLIE